MPAKFKHSRDNKKCSSRSQSHHSHKDKDKKINRHKKRHKRSRSRSRSSHKKENSQKSDICQSNRDELGQQPIQNDSNIIPEAREHELRQENLIMKKLLWLDDEENMLNKNHNLEYYPNLILASIHLADCYPEKKDRKLFEEYKSKRNMRFRSIKKGNVKIGKHNINRIISIADSLESMAEDNQKEKILEHHSLDFFSQFEHLRKMNRIKFANNNQITGVVKQEEVKEFMNKCDLRYEVFMN